MKKKKSNFYKARSTETQYARALRAVAREVGRIIDAFQGDLTLATSGMLAEALRKYSTILTPWARAKAALMLAQVDGQDQRAWRKATKEMSLEIRETVKNTPVGERLQELMNENVKLITSLPTQAAERVHKLVLENFEEQNRSSEIAEEIKRSGKVASSRATLIARTEVARASSLLTQSRAEFVGGEGYIWRTVRDSDVRLDHKKLEGKFIRFDSPPKHDDGMTYHAGQGPNCRCFMEPIIPEELFS